ncbi:MAG: polysaccharide pyruvyl transferase family protein [Clostridia bacterium]|nr:polysaccharide pyruvyl transferase family protein [Clostridia bacterium]
MKILILTMKMGIGGAETHIVELCRALTLRSHKVDVASSGGELVRELTALGVEHITLPLDKKDPISIIHCRRELRRLIVDEGYDVVHAHARIPAFVAAPVCRALDVRFFTTAHYDFRVNPILRRLSEWGEHTFAVSEDISRYLKKNYFIDSENITVVPNGIDRMKFSRDMAAGEAVRSSLCAEKRKIVLHVSRLDGNTAECAKNLLRAAGKSNGDRLLFVFVGGGDRFDELKTEGEMINHDCRARVCEFVGAKSDVVPYLSAADVFVGPSRAALEAMSVGVPTIISGPEGHIGALSRDNFGEATATNLCCRSGNAADGDILWDEIQNMLSQNDERRRALLSLQDELLSHYTVEEMADLYEREYLRLCGIKTKCAPRAVICGYYGYGNAGDRAMLYSLVRGIRRTKPDAPLCVMSNSPKKTAREFVVGAVSRYNVFAVKKKIKEAGVLIFGGGNLIQDSTSRRSLKYYLYILKCAGRLGAKVIVYANGIGPLSVDGAKDAVPVLSGAEYVSMRDKASLDFCLEHGIDAKLTADPAFSLDHGVIPHVRGGYFVVAPKKTDDDGFAALCGAVRRLSEKYSLRPVIAAMYSAQDAAFCRRVAIETGALLLEDGITDYGILTTAVAGAEFVLSARFHALVCAAAVGCPMISVGSEKNASLLRDLGFSWCAVRSYSEVVDVICRVLDSSGEIRAAVSARAKDMRAAAICEVDTIAGMME